jgi:copper chaperone CopZ
MKTSVIEVRDMLSVLSVVGVEKRIEEVPGVESVTVDFAAANATIRYDETRLNLADIKSDVRQSGYESAAPKVMSGRDDHKVHAASGPLPSAPTSAAPKAAPDAASPKVAKGAPADAAQPDKMKPEKAGSAPGAEAPKPSPVTDTPPASKPAPDTAGVPTPGPKSDGQQDESAHGSS